MESARGQSMGRFRVVVVAAVIALMTAAPLRGQRLKIDYTFANEPPRPAIAAALHPAAKGAVVGAVAGAGFWGGVGIWYCTIGPNEAGECTRGRWTRGMLMWSAAGAAVGALIGALR